MPQVANPVGSEKAGQPSTYANASSLLLAIPTLLAMWHGPVSFTEPAFYTAAGAVLAGVVGLFLKPKK